MKFKNLVLGFFLAASFAAEAQQTIGPQVGGITLTPFTTKGKSVDDIGGYFTEEWSQGSVAITADAKTVSVSSMRYNIANDKIMIQDGAKVFEFPKGSILSFTIKAKDKETGLLRDYNFVSGIEGVDKFTASNFFLVHYNTAKVKLLTKYSVVLQNAAASTYGSNAQELTYSQKKTLYLYKDGKGIAIKKNKKAIIEALGGDKKVWEEYIKANKLDLKEDADIIRFLQFYETKTA